MNTRQEPACTQKLSADLLPQSVRAVRCEMDSWVEQRAIGHGSYELAHLGGLDIFRYRSEGLHRGNRRPEHIRRDQLDTFFLYLPLSTEFRFSQHGSVCKVVPGQFALVTTTRPFDISARPRSQTDAFVALYVRIPAPLLRRRYPQADDVCNMAFPLASASGQMLLALLVSSIENGPALSRPEADKVGALVLELIAGTIEREADTADMARPRREIVRSHILSLANAFIAANLSNPQLGTSLVARHCNISARYLQKIFQAAPMNVAETIRELRLQRCREFLRTPGVCDRTIGEIAATWGFGQATHFSRAYKARFGVTPKEDRRALRTGD